MMSLERPGRGTWFRRRSGKYEIKERPKTWHAIGNYRKIIKDEEFKEEEKSQISTRTNIRQSMPPSPPLRSPLTRLQTVAPQSDMRILESGQSAHGQDVKSTQKPTANNLVEDEEESDINEGQNGNGIGNNLNQDKEKESIIMI